MTHPLLLSALLGCASNVHTLYEQARAQALADPGPPPESWTPHATLAISWPLVDGLFAEALDDRLKKAGKPTEISLPLGLVARLTPDLGLEEAHMGPAPDCGSCALIRTSFSGSLRWTVGTLEGHLPMDAAVDVVVNLASSPAQGGGLKVEAELKRVGVRLLKDLSLPRVEADLSSPMATWVQERFQKDFPRIEVARVGDAETPLRALRIQPVTGDLRIGILTGSPSVTDVSDPERGDAAWAVAISQQALLDLARRVAFEEGPDEEYGVVPEPVSISMDGNRFDMGLKLWRLEGRGWWRTYDVAGAVKVGQKRMKMEPRDVKETGHSRGAGLADPLVALAKGYVLKAIEEGATIAEPAHQRQELGASVLVLSIDQLEGRKGNVYVLGSASNLGEGLKKKAPRP